MTGVSALPRRASHTQPAASIALTATVDVPSMPASVASTFPPCDALQWAPSAYGPRNRGRPSPSNTATAGAAGSASNLVAVHVHGLRRKLDPRLIRSVRGLGYRLADATP